MVPEALVFKPDYSTRELFGNCVGGWESPLPIGGDACAQQTPVAALQHCADRIVEKRPWPKRQRQQGYCRDYADQYVNILAQGQ